MKRPELMIVSGALNGRRFEVKDGGVRLGRSSSNDIHIPDEELSRNHCLFERKGEDGICVTDLASANGTFVNGVSIGSAPQELRLGDLIEVGATVISVVGDQPLDGPGGVDLGLGDAKRPAPVARVSARRIVLWTFALAVAAIGALAVVLTQRSSVSPVVASALTEVAPAVVEVRYEKVEASTDGIVRYELTVSRDGMLRVTVDDTEDNRHVAIPPQALDEKGKAELNALLAFESLREVDRDYLGGEADPQELKSRSLSVVYTTRVRRVRVVNVAEPEAFRVLCEKLEMFANNELGIHALRYSREKLVSLAEEQISIGAAKWGDRDVQYGNLSASVAAYREALFYLETLNPKPECVTAARTGLERARAELDRRYGDQRFAVDRAINLGDWETAQRELKVLRELIPDRRDDRNREATAKLVDVERRLKGAKK